jgi:hypothetical protein
MGIRGCEYQRHISLKLHRGPKSSAFTVNVGKGISELITRGYGHTLLHLHLLNGPRVTHKWAPRVWSTRPFPRCQTQETLARDVSSFARFGIMWGFFPV